jgi:hypothetical protein
MGPPDIFITIMAHIWALFFLTYLILDLLLDEKRELGIGVAILVLMYFLNFLIISLNFVSVIISIHPNIRIHW